MLKKTMKAEKTKRFTIAEAQGHQRRSYRVGSINREQTEGLKVYKERSEQ